MQGKHGGSRRSLDCYLKRSLRSVEKKKRGKDCLKATDSKINACSDIDIGEVLFHYVTFCDKENRDLSSKIYLVSFDGIF